MRFRLLNILFALLLISFQNGAQVKSPPGWTINPYLYQYNATITAKVLYNNQAMPAGNNMLGAFAGSELRGVATPIPYGTGYLFFLTVYTNNSSDNLTFKIYLASIDSILPVQETMSIVPNGTYGTVGSPVIFNSYYNFDHAPVVRGISDQTIEAGGSFNIFDLDNYLTELDGNTVTWSYRGNNHFTVLVGSGNEVTITPLSEIWTGADTIIFRATDNTVAHLYGEDTAVFKVLSVDHPPHLTSLPSKTIGLGSQFPSLNLRDYLTELDSDSLNWSFEFDVSGANDPKPSWSVEPGSFNSSMTVTAEVYSLGKISNSPNCYLAAFNGSELRGVTRGIQYGAKYLYFLTLYSSSSGENITFRFYDSLSKKNIPVKQSVTFSSNGTLGSPSAPYTMDAGNIIAIISSAGVATFTLPSLTWTGSEKIKFTVKDAGTIHSYTDTASVIYTVINDHAPIVGNIADQVIQQNQSFASFDLDNYILELDDNQVTWSTAGNSILNISIDANHVVQVTSVNPLWAGTEKIIFRATDNTAAALYGEDTASFTVTPVDHKPYLSVIPNQMTGLGGSFNPLDLNGYVTEIDGHSFTLTYSVAAPVSTDPVPSWSITPSGFNFQMTMIIEVTTNSVKRKTSGHLLAAFAGSELRGVVSPFQFGGKWLYFLTVYSNSGGETISFKFYDAVLQKIYPVNETVIFSGSASYGSPDSPYQLNAGNIIFNLAAGSRLNASVTDASWYGSETLTVTAKDVNTASLLYDTVRVSYTVQSSPLTPVNAPSGLAVTALNGPLRNHLVWTDNAGNETRYVIRRKAGDSTAAIAYVNLDTISANSISYDDANVSDTTKYTYCVYAYNTQLNSGISNQSTVTTSLTYPELTLTVMLEGMMNPANTGMRQDTISVLLKYPASPYNTIDSVKCFTDTLGNVKLYCPSASRNGNYFIVVRHRNSLETWSGIAKSFNSGLLTYNFTNSNTSAYGNNLILKGTKWCLYAGDVNQDGVIDFTDIRLIDNDNYNNVTGYRSTDINGDWKVDYNDIKAADTNCLYYRKIIRP